MRKSDWPFLCYSDMMRKFFSRNFAMKSLKPLELFDGVW